MRWSEAEADGQIWVEINPPVMPWLGFDDQSEFLGACEQFPSARQRQTQLGRNACRAENRSMYP
ncbi:hypothetical protein YP76_24115 [Sphingobium chungbukense]|uniref:Uncharacterized protein n=1 Tax=Sphingobium chungbukense TaxID=56193 RepID=A0A0M3AIB9_9SPHN|nr:hypothetical protein YP76_24115 [Sphingobium chungbukense]